MDKIRLIGHWFACLVAVRFPDGITLEARG